MTSQGLMADVWACQRLRGVQKSFFSHIFINHPASLPPITPRMPNNHQHLFTFFISHIFRKAGRIAYNFQCRGADPSRCRLAGRGKEGGKFRRLLPAVDS